MDTLKRQFNNAIKREGKTITSYYKQEEFQCIFRRNSNTNSTEEHLTILYDVFNNIYQGQLLTYKDKHYLVLNQESIENDIYYKSSLLQCNSSVPLVSDSIINNIPCYAGDLYSTILSNGSTIDLIDGRVDIITESTDFVNNAKIDSKSQFMGGYYTLKNKANKSGIAYLYFERGQEPVHTYSLDLTSSTTSYEINTTTQLTATAKTDGLVDNTGTIVFTSSDDLLATVDSTGLVTFKAEGIVTITAIWIENNVQKSLELTITETAIPESYVVEITSPDISNDEIKIQLTNTFTGIVKDSIGNVVTPTNLVFTIDNNYSGKVVLTDKGNGTCTIVIDGNAYDLITEQFTLTCQDMYSGFSGTWNLMIVGLW